MSGGAKRETHDAHTVLAVGGQELTVATAGDFKKRLDEAVEAATQDVVVDMAGVDILDSVALSVFIGAHLKMAQKHGHLRIVNASSQIRELFESMRLDKHFFVQGGE